MMHPLPLSSPESRQAIQSCKLAAFAAALEVCAAACGAFEAAYAARWVDDI
jgi:hypothetical protein